MINHLTTVALICAVLSVAPITSAQTTSDLLEQGIYTEHTVGDLNEAIKIYEQIVSETQANRANAAKALLRLGSCYQKLGNTDKAEEYFEQLVENYSDQTQFVAEAQSLLKEFAMAELDLLPPPWQESAVYHYETLSPAGLLMGISEHQITKEVVDGIPQWNIQTFTVGAGGKTTYGKVEVSAESFKPIRSERVKSNKGPSEVIVSEVIYESEQIRVISADSEPTSVQPGAIYDSHQFSTLLQRLPLRLGYEEEFSILSYSDGMFDSTIKVTGIEETNVPAGTFESYRLEHQVWQDGKHVMKQEYWISTGSEKEVLRIKYNDIEHRLIKNSQFEHENSPLYNNPELGISFSAQRSWYIYDDSLDERAARVYLYPEEPGLEGEFTARLIPPHQLESHTAEQMTENHQTQNNRFFKDYLVRPESEIDIEIGGIPARSYIADFEFQGKKMFEYRTILRTQDMGYWFTFRGEPDLLEANKAQLDFISNSLIAP